jgi:cytochrome b561
MLVWLWQQGYFLGNLILAFGYTKILLIALCLISFLSSYSLQYNDNTGNPYSDVFWLAALVQPIGEFEFGQQVHELLLWLILKITCMSHLVTRIFHVYRL